MDSCCVICTLLLLLGGVESLICSCILLADQFVIATIRIASWNFSVLHFGLFKMRAASRVCPGPIICEDIALFVCECRGSVKFSLSPVKYLQGPPAIRTVSSTLSVICFVITFYCYNLNLFIRCLLQSLKKKKKARDKGVHLLWFCLTYPVKLMLLAVTVVPCLPGVTIEMKSGTASALRSFGFRLSKSPVAGRKETTFRATLRDEAVHISNAHNVSAVALLTQTHAPEVLLSVSPIQDPVCHHVTLQLCFG